MAQETVERRKHRNIIRNWPAIVPTYWSPIRNKASARMVDANTYFIIPLPSFCTLRVERHNENDLVSS